MQKYADWQKSDYLALCVKLLDTHLILIDLNTEIINMLCDQSAPMCMSNTKVNELNNDYNPAHVGHELSSSEEDSRMWLIVQMLINIKCRYQIFINACRIKVSELHS